ncbi:MAG: PIN domain-containing protein [Methanotrichaceae archaeon]
MERREEEAGLVVDTNILIAALLKDHSINARLIKSGYFNVYFPEYGMIEMGGYFAYIEAKRKKSSQSLSFEYAKSFILRSIQVVPSDLYRSRMKDAFEVMKEIDEKDAPILALAMQLCYPIWSNDKHFQRQKAAKVYTTSDVLRMLKKEYNFERLE